MVYTKKQVDKTIQMYKDLLKIVGDFEIETDRHFTLDGHLIGSIGEVIASYIYGIDLCKAGQKIYDGIVDGKEVQIKITQRNSIVIHDEPQYLIALYLKEDGSFYEIYNGPGKDACNKGSKRDTYFNTHVSVSNLIKLNNSDDIKDKKIKVKHNIELYKK
jgi:hypothetical protein